jgi:hypothetical protein
VCGHARRTTAGRNFRGAGWRGVGGTAGRGAAECFDEDTEEAEDVVEGAGVADGAAVIWDEAEDRAEDGSPVLDGTLSSELRSRS